jgi:hypothetical protein
VRTIRTEVGIRRPAGAVWAILVDIDRWPEERCRFAHFETFTGVLARPVLWLAGDASRRGFEATNLALKARGEGA